MMRWIWSSAFIVVLLGMTGFMFINLSDGDPDDWHQDPVTAEGTGRPNEYRVAPPGVRQDAVDSAVYAMTPAALAQALDAVAMASPRVSRLAGDPEEGFTTYVQRSRFLGWPDYISVRALPVDGGAALAIWSRARYGYSDLGVNQARVREWLAALPDG